MCLEPVMDNGQESYFSDASYCECYKKQMSFSKNTYQYFHKLYNSVHEKKM